jgi:hypothetical protein
VACAPQNAELTAGSYTAFLADSSSLTVAKGLVPFDDEAFSSSYKVDCREFVTANNNNENETLRLDDRLPICAGSIFDNDEGVTNADWPPEHEVWLGQDGFHVVTQDLEPWRGEAIMTSEGDFQIGFHHRLPGGEDFRFAFAIDPNFQPTVCEQTADGAGTELANVDGDWLGNWSKDLKGDDNGGTLFYLNARAYQFNPDDPDGGQIWSSPEEWRAGYSAGKFADEEFTMRTPRYGEPAIYTALEAEDGYTVTEDDLFFCDLFEGEDPNTSNCMEGLIEDVNDVASEVGTELERVLVDYTPMVHDNTWRDPDGYAPGYDGWVGMHYNWVVIDAGSDLSEGGSASGKFAMVFDAYDSYSRFFVQGEFNVDKIKNDVWTTDDLRAIKLEENGTVLCGG